MLLNAEEGVAPCSWGSESGAPDRAASELNRLVSPAQTEDYYLFCLIQISNGCFAPSRLISAKVCHLVALKHTGLGQEKKKRFCWGYICHTPIILPLELCFLTIESIYFLFYFNISSTPLLIKSKYLES